MILIPTLQKKGCRDNGLLRTNLHIFMALFNKEIAGTFIITRHQPGPGSRIVNTSYMPLPSSTTQGIGKVMKEL
jgi:hypothetical protein